MLKPKLVYMVELEGTRLDDYGYVKASSSRAAKRKVKVELKKRGLPESLMPKLKATRVSEKYLSGDFEGCTPVAIEALNKGRILFDFEDFQVDDHRDL